MSKQKKETIGQNLITNAKSSQGFGPSCAPGWCVWYIAAKMYDSKEVILKNISGLKMFVGKINNHYDAYLLLQGFYYTSARGIPLVIGVGNKFKRVKNGYLISVLSIIRDCPITDANIIYFVGDDKRITVIRVLNVEVGKGCV
jgi:hypothetical protein